MIDHDDRGRVAETVRASPVGRAGGWPAVRATEGRAGGDRRRAGAAVPVVAAGENRAGLALRAKIVLACADGRSTPRWRPGCG